MARCGHHRAIHGGGKCHIGFLALRGVERQFPDFLSALVQQRLSIGLEQAFHGIEHLVRGIPHLGRIMLVCHHLGNHATMVDGQHLFLRGRVRQFGNVCLDIIPDAIAVAIRAGQPVGAARCRARLSFLDRGSSQQRGALKPGRRGRDGVAGIAWVMEAVGPAMKPAPADAGAAMAAIVAASTSGRTRNARNEKDTAVPCAERACCISLSSQRMVGVWQYLRPSVWLHHLPAARSV